MPYVASIGYELATPRSLVAELKRARIVLLVDVRAIPNSRRPGFSKRALGTVLAEAGIDYLHLRALGTPAEGRAAARKGRHEVMRRIYAVQIKTLAARDDLTELEDRIRAGLRVCLLCLEASPEHCHRSLIIAELKRHRRGLTVEHLSPAPDPKRLRP